MPKVWAVVIALLAIALWPTLGRVHVEGFSYLTETISVLFPDIAASDPLWGVNSEFFYLTRPGASWLMAPLSDLSPGNGYNILTWLVLPPFLFGLVLVTRLWSGASWLASASTLLLLPISVEVGHFYNDNIVAMSFSLWALASVLAGPSLIWPALSGALLSIAILCRLDNLLLLPLMLFLAGLPADRLHRALLRSVLLVAAAIAVHLLASLVDPAAANLFGRIELAAQADALWSRDQFPLHDLFASDASAWLTAFGLGVPAIIAGIVEVRLRSRVEAASAEGSVMDRLRHWSGPLCFFVYPLAIYALTMGKYYDPRGFLTMLPLLAPLAALGADRWMFEPLRAGRALGSQSSVGALLILAPLLIPGVPAPPEPESPVTSLTGRIWHGGDWRSWQTAVQRRDANLRRLVTEQLPRGETSVLVARQWTPDRRAQNTLATEGFRLVTERAEGQERFASLPDSPAAACDTLSETWRHPDGTQVRLLRLHVPFLANAATKTDAALVLARPCLEQSASDRRFVIDRAEPVRLSGSDLDARHGAAVANLRTLSPHDAPRRTALEILQTADSVLNR
ncbi:hypothetical protein ROJ8625_00237 [Roseivivax jejudonensis]|uniref:Glycosyltransferase RgtA/B/C/D-like domain-containing protein n=1 Tax=Roseivivax jejudonensis TaxID=1529041 RepID=A0A1X6Y551_9RHOB|nr:hypothetical protein [Roseivivax jejudonensis]SLN11055.1 hypothetical protein ROJ8625_00237 [Roseivivax jejudonensis]